MGFMSVTCLVLVYALNTWLPELMTRAGFSTKGSLSFLLVLNGGAVIGALVGSRIADRFGPKPVVAGCFLIGALSIAVLTLSLPLGLLLLFVAIVGLGTSGTQTLIYGFVANYFTTKVRGAAVAWCAGFGRLGGVGGPLLGGFLVAAGLALSSIFYVLAASGPAGHDPDAARAEPAHARPALDAHRALGHRGPGRAAGRARQPDRMTRHETPQPLPTTS